MVGVESQRNDHHGCGRIRVYRWGHAAHFYTAEDFLLVTTLSISLYYCYGS